MSDRTVLFDEELLKILRTLKGVEVFESIAENTDAPLYLVVHTGNEMGALYTRNLAISGHQDDVYDHPFDIEVWGTDRANVIKLASWVKEKLIGAILVDGSTGINVLPTLTGRSDYDASMRPTKFTRYLAFTVRLDRSQR